jgi:hypothetical protein
VRAVFTDAPIMVAVAKCESGFRQFDHTGHPLFGGTGGMEGVFQLAAAIHGDTAQGLGYDISTLDGNLAYARYLYDNEGLVPWLASQNCWSPAPISSALHLGSTGKQVLSLQKLLNKLGYLVATSGSGSPGHESSTFGTGTLAAVQKFQCAMKIVCSGTTASSGYGMVGAKTRLALHKMDATLTKASVTDLTAQR